MRKHNVPRSTVFVTLAAVAMFVAPSHMPDRPAEALGDATRPYVLSSPVFSPKAATSFTTLFTSVEDVSMSMLLRRYDAVGTLLTSQAITIGAHGSLQASPAAHSGAPLHVEIWAPRPGIHMRLTYTDSASVTQRIEGGDMILPRASGATFAALAPFRACDTRTAGANCPQGKLGAGGEIAVQLAGVGGVPPVGVKAVTVNLTVANTTTTGHLDAWPDGEVRPNASTVNYTANVAIANMVTVKLGTNGKIRLRNSAGTTNVIVDVAGYYA